MSFRFKKGNYVRIKKVYTGHREMEAKEYYVGRIAQIVGIEKGDSFPYRVRYLDNKLRKMNLSETYTFRCLDNNELELATEDEAMAEMI